MSIALLGKNLNAHFFLAVQIAQAKAIPAKQERPVW
jgi:hypothetical protein